MTSLTFTFIDESGENSRNVEIATLVIAGWTGRDTEAMEKHIQELEEIGIPRPSRTPCFYRASHTLLTQADEIQVIGNDSSGEVEFFILALDDGLWVGVGSDHTDRKVEAYDVAVSKQMCPKPVSQTVWRYDEIASHWDDLRLISDAEIEDTTERYQEGPVTVMRSPEELISLYTNGGSLAPGTLMYCGTLTVLGGVRPAGNFSVSLEDQVSGRIISHSYKITELPPEE